MLVLATGIALRIVAFAYMGYLNNDNHLTVIEYIAQRWILAYLIVDVLLALLYPVNSLRTNHIPYEIDMNAR